MIHLNDYDTKLSEIVAIVSVENHLEVKLEDGTIVHIKATEEEVDELCRRFLKHELLEKVW